MPPLVSILIPCYNAAPWLAATLDSAFAQTWPHKEIILVDDGSRDDSLAIARRYESRGLKIISRPNSGAAVARNVALAASTGAWLQFLDADDLLAPDKIAQQLALPAAALTGSYILSASWTRFTQTPGDADYPPQPLCTDLSPVAFAITKLERNAMMHPAAWLVPRALSDRAGPWDESLTLDDDGEYFTRLVLQSQGTRHAAASLSYYRSGLLGSLSRTKSERAWASAFRSLELTVTRLRASADSPVTRHACATALQRYLYEAYPAAAACRSRAAVLVAALGGSDLSPDGGPKFNFARRLLGWKLAKRLLLARSRR
ncbi:MAG: glycosyltransferase [Undibacterium sp.]|nr:glycosyltransferase [Opitutaceae bacterium]